MLVNKHFYNVTRKENYVICRYLPNIIYVLRGKIPNQKPCDSDHLHMTF